MSHSDSTRVPIRLKCGAAVYYQLSQPGIPSPVADALEQNPKLALLLLTPLAALALVDLPEGEEVEACHVFPEVIGDADCVGTDEGDDCYFAWELGRLGPTRFVRNRLPQPTCELTYSLLRPAGEDYAILTEVHLGGPIWPEPWTEWLNERQNLDACEWWYAHARVPNDATTLADEQEEEWQCGAFWMQNGGVENVQPLKAGT